MLAELSKCVLAKLELTELVLAQLAEPVTPVELVSPVLVVNLTELAGVAFVLAELTKLVPAAPVVVELCRQHLRFGRELSRNILRSCRGCPRRCPLQAKRAILFAS